MHMKFERFTDWTVQGGQKPHVSIEIQVAI